MIPDPVDLHDDPPSWREEAACRGMDPDLFFPERGESTAEAKAVCRACLVRTPCLDEALAEDPGRDRGIWGGLSGARAASHPTAAEEVGVTAITTSAGYSSSEVLRRTGLTYRQLDYMDRTGVVSASSWDGPGKGTGSEDDIRAIRAVQALMLWHDGANSASAWKRSVLRKAAAVAAATRPKSLPQWLVVGHHGTMAVCGAADLGRHCIEAGPSAVVVSLEDRTSA